MRTNRNWPKPERVNIPDAPAKYSDYECTRRAWRDGFELGWKRATQHHMEGAVSPLLTPVEFTRSERVSDAFKAGLYAGAEAFLAAHEVAQGVVEDIEPAVTRGGISAIAVLVALLVVFFHGCARSTPQTSYSQESEHEEREVVKISGKGGCKNGACMRIVGTDDYASKSGEIVHGGSETESK